MKKKEIVFIDTCIYISENYFCSENRIQTLAGLAKDGVISLISTEITDKEIIANLTKNSMVSYNSLRRKYEVLKNFEDESLFEKKKKENIANLAEIKVRKFLKNAHVLNLGYEYCNDVKYVFDKYFSEERPFHEGNKKNEFPDAFVLSALEKYCSKYGVKIIVLSNDKDLLKYESKFLQFQDYKNFVTDKLAEKDLKERIKKLLKVKAECIEKALSDELSEALSDESLYYDLVNCEDFDDVNIEKCKVNIDKSDLDIISKEEKTYIIEVRANAVYSVKLYFNNLDYAVYDWEDHFWYGGEKDTYDVDKNIPFTFKLKYTDSSSSAEGDITPESFNVKDMIEI